MKKLVCIFLVITIIFSETILVYAGVNNDYGFVLEEVSPESIGFESERELVNPYTLYIMGATTHITDKGDGKIHMGVEVYCTYRMKKITTTFYLQQLISNQWVEVCSATGSVNDSDFMIKFISVSYPPSGSYRVRTINMVEDYNGYAEAVEGYSGDIVFVSPYT